MSANFYNASGSMNGLDLHVYWGSAEIIVPVPGMALHVVHADFDGVCSDEGNRLASVTSSGKPTLQAGFTRKDVKPHLPVLPLLPPPVAIPHFALEPGQLSVIYKFSSSAAVLKKASVTGVGVPLAICIHGAFGTNLNCGDPIDTPSDVVYNENSVKTDPSAADFATAWAEATINALVGATLGKVVELLFGNSLLEPLRKAIEDKIKDKINELLKKPAEEKIREVLGSMGVTHV